MRRPTSPASSPDDRGLDSPERSDGLTLLPGAFASLLRNLDEIWAARRLAVRVGWFELPASYPWNAGTFGISTRFADEHLGDLACVDAVAHAIRRDTTQPGNGP